MINNITKNDMRRILCENESDEMNFVSMENIYNYYSRNTDEDYEKIEQLEKREWRLLDMRREESDEIIRQLKGKHENQMYKALEELSACIQIEIDKIAVEKKQIKDRQEALKAYKEELEAYRPCGKVTLVAALEALELIL